MKLRKRKSTENQVELPENGIADMENTAPSSVIKEEEALKKYPRRSKRAKLGEEEPFSDNSIKTEEDSNGIDNFKEEDSHREEVNEKTKVSEDDALKVERNNNLWIFKVKQLNSRVHHHFLFSII